MPRLHGTRRRPARSSHWSPDDWSPDDAAPLAAGPLAEEAPTTSEHPTSALIADDVPILVVGGGPVGLTTALLLARQGVKTLLVERHAGTSIHPRARGINVRSMEIFRSLGLEDAIRAAGAPLAKNRCMLWVETLAGPEVRRVPLGGFNDEARIRELSPTSWAACAQDDLEPILAAEARRLGAEVRFGTELVSFSQDRDGVTACLRDRATGAERQVRARYLVAADGSRSQVRSALGIGWHGPGALSHAVSVYFRADLTALVADRWFVLCFVEDPAVRGLLMSVNNTDRWIFQAPYEPSEIPVSAFSPERCTDLVRRAVGRPDLPVEILAIIPWEPSASVSETFRDGRVLLAGDAAHVVPPAGAFGMNVGIQDAHNLAWKLGAVVRGEAGPPLLETYDQERRPVAKLILAHTVGDASRRFSHATPGRTILHRGRRPGSGPASVTAPPQAPVDDLTAMLGYWYASSAVVDAPRPAPTLAELGRAGLVLDGRPGTRAPHAWIERDGQRASTLDLFEGRLTLVAGPEAEGWIDALQVAASVRGLEVQSLRISVDGGGAMLVRPDGFVGWRSGSGERPSAEQLGQMLDRLLGRA